MLMLGTSSYQRIDGMGLARKALEALPTGDTRRDLSKEERSMLANARAWCLLVHGDLGHLSRLDDPFVLADAERFVEVARGLSPGSPSVETTVALLRLRQGRTAEATGEHRTEPWRSSPRMPEHERSGRTQGAAILAVVTQALVAASSGDTHGRRVLCSAARAVVTPLDLDEAAFAALLARSTGRSRVAPDCEAAWRIRVFISVLRRCCIGFTSSPSLWARAAAEQLRRAVPLPGCETDRPRASDGVAAPDGGQSDDVETARDRAAMAVRERASIVATRPTPLGSSTPSR